MDVAAASSPSLLLGLPNELLEHVSNSLVRDNSLLSLRLACSELNSRLSNHIRKCYFTNWVVYIYFVKSLDTFQAIAKDQTIRRYVKSVRVATVGHVDIFYRHKKSCESRQNMPESICGRFKAERMWLRAGAGAALFTSALKLLPNVNDIGRVRDSSCVRSDFLQKLAQQAVPESEHSCYRIGIKHTKDNCHQMHALLLAAVVASDMNLHSMRSETDRRSFQASYESRRWHPVPDALVPTLKSKLCGLRRLDIGVNPFETQTRTEAGYYDLEAFGQMMSFACNISHLSLTIEDGRYRKSIPPRIRSAWRSFYEALAEVELARLQELRLNSICDYKFHCRRSMLNKIIGLYSKTLTSLTLSGLTMRGSLVPCLRFIRDKMNLSELRLIHMDEHSHREGMEYLRALPAPPPPPLAGMQPPMIPPPPRPGSTLSLLPPSPGCRRCIFLRRVHLTGVGFLIDLKNLMDNISAPHEHKAHWEWSANSDSEEYDSDSSDGSFVSIPPPPPGNIPPPPMGNIGLPTPGHENRRVLRPRFRGRAIAPSPAPRIRTLSIPYSLRARTPNIESSPERGPNEMPSPIIPQPHMTVYPIPPPPPAPWPQHPPPPAQPGQLPTLQQLLAQIQ